MPITPNGLKTFSIILLIFGLATTIMPPIFHKGGYFFNILSIALYIPSFILLYISQKYRYFVISPTMLVYLPEGDNRYEIIPWTMEGETRWETKLKKLKIKTSKSIKLKGVRLIDMDLLKDMKINPTSSGYVYEASFDEDPLELDINSKIIITIERDENIDERTPFLEYTIDYKPTKLPFTLRTTRRIT